MTGIGRAAGERQQGNGPRLSPGQAAVMAGIAARAPSVHNTQPWRFWVAGNALQIRVDRSRRLAAVDPAGREMLISCGAAVYGARLAARSLGRRPAVSLLPDPRQPDVIAQVRLGGPMAVTPRERELLAAVPHRHTRRGMFTDDPLPPGLLAGLQQDAMTEGAVLMFVPGTGSYYRLAALVAAADRWQRQDRLVRAELARWVRPPGSPARDGIPARACPARTPTLRTSAGGWLPPRDFSPSHAHRPGERSGPGQAGGSGTAGRQADGGEADGGGAPPAATAILLTAADTPADWLRAGQALHRLLLRAASRWVFASMNTGPLESPVLRSLVRSRLGLPGAPQALLQLGSARTAPATPRRPITELLSWE